MSAVGEIITEWQGRQKFTPNLSDIGRTMRPPVSRSTVAKWVSGQSVPTPTHLRALAQVITDVPYWRFCEAVLVDSGYLEGGGHRGDAAPMNQ